MSEKQTWQAAKKAWEKVGEPKLDLPVLAQMKKLGWDKGDLAKKLGAFDGAKNLKDKQAAWAPAFEQASKYQGILGKAIQLSKEPKAKAELKKLDEALDSILKTGVEATQTPKPGARSEKLRLVAVQNAAAGLKPKWLEVGAIDIKSHLIVDGEVARLEKEGELGFHWTELQKACSETVDKSTSAFWDTINKVDRSIEMLEQKDRAAKIKEANDVLKHYAGIVEKNVADVVDDYWARALKRQAYLKDFKKECKTDIAMSGVTIAVSAVSIAMSFGAAALSAVAIAKSVLDIALALEKIDRDATKVRGILEGNMESVMALYQQRLDAKKSGAGQKASKAAEVGKTAVASALGPISAKLMTTTSRTLKEAKEYVGKLSLLETEAGKLNKKLEEYTKSFSSSPEGPDAHKNTAMKKLHNNFKAMAAQYQDFTKALQQDIAWGEMCIEICEKLEDEDAIVKYTGTAGTVTKVLVALGSLAKLGVQLGVALA